MSALVAVIGAGVVSYLLRVSMLVVAERYGLPAVVERAARLAVPAAFAALAAASLASHTSWRPEDLAPVVAVGVGVAAARRTGSASMAIAAGMPTSWLLAALLG